MADFNWGDLFTGAATTAASYGMKRTEQYKKARQQQDVYNQVSDALSSQLKQFDTDYAQELSGQLTEQEKKTRDVLLNKTMLDANKAVAEQAAILQQQYARSGIGGTALAQAMAELEAKKNQAIKDYTTELDASLMEKAMNRATQAKGLRQQLLSQINQTLTPLSAQTDQVVSELGGSSFADYLKGYGQEIVAPTIAATIAGGNQMFNKDYTGPSAEQAFRETSVAKSLTDMGINPSIFTPPSAEVPKEVGGEIYTPIKGRSITGESYTSGFSKQLSPEVIARTQQASAQKATAVGSLLNNIDSNMKDVSTGDLKPKDAVRSINQQISVFNQLNNTNLALVKESDLKDPNFFQKIQAKLAGNTIRVQDIKSGQTGTINAEDFDPKKYKKI